MASVTFGSVGDIITICQVITTTIKALSASRGSDVEYRGLINELWSLAQALESIKSLLEEDTEIKHRGRLRIALQNCRECLERELESIRKFSTSLGKVASTKSARDAFWRTRWLGHKVNLLHRAFQILRLASMTKGKRRPISLPSGRPYRLTHRLLPYCCRLLGFNCRETIIPKLLLKSMSSGKDCGKTWTMFKNLKSASVWGLRTLSQGLNAPW